MRYCLSSTCYFSRYIRMYRAFACCLILSRAFYYCSSVFGSFLSRSLASRIAYNCYFFSRTAANFSYNLFWAASLAALILELAAYSNLAFSLAAALALSASFFAFCFDSIKASYYSLLLSLWMLCFSSLLILTRYSRDLVLFYFRSLFCLIRSSRSAFNWAFYYSMSCKR